MHAVAPASVALITRIARAQVVLVKTGDRHGAAHVHVGCTVADNNCRHGLACSFGAIG